MKNSKRRLCIIFIGILAFQFTQLKADNFWEETPTPSVGYVYSMTMCPNDNIFVGTFGNGVWRSTDGGEEWSESGNDLSGKDVWSMASNSQNHIFVTALVGFGNDANLYKSSNNGDNWVEIGGSLSSAPGEVAISSDDDIYVGTEGGHIYRSLDNGDNWEQVYNGSGATAIFINAIACAGNETIYAGVGDDYSGSGHVLQSTNNGETWSIVGPADYFLSIACDNSGKVFAGGLFTGVHRSLDNGQSWESSSSGIDYDGIQSLFVSPNGDVYAGSKQLFEKTGGALYLSTDDGASWVKENSIENGLGSDNIVTNRIVANSAGNIITGTIGAGVFKKTDDGWENIGFLTPMVKSFSQHTDGEMFVLLNNPVTESAAVFVFNEETLIWAPIIVSDFGMGDVVVASSGDIYVGGGGITSARSTDKGETWSDMIINGVSNINTFTSTSNGKLIAGTAQGIYTSDNDGDSWTTTGVSLYTISLYTASNDDIYAGTGNYNINGELYRSTDGGDNWELLYGVGTLQFVNSVVVNSTGDIFFGMGDENNSQGLIYRSTNNGSNFTQSASINYVTCIVADDEDNLFAATIGGGVFYSSDNGDNWDEFNEGLSGYKVLSLFINQAGLLYAGTWENGISRRTTSVSINNQKEPYHE